MGREALCFAKGERPEAGIRGERAAAGSLYVSESLFLAGPHFVPVSRGDPWHPHTVASVRALARASFLATSL